jgi:anti-sigma regulatory factor (Ser/Thr protein kinase)
MPFNALPEKDFIGRHDELAGLSKRVLQADTATAQSVVLSGPRGIGKTELLKQVFGRLFWKQDRVAPFYYAVNPALLSAAAFSKTYLIGFLCQRLAFENKEQALVYHEGTSLDRLSALAEERDAVWAKEIIDQYEQSSGDPVNALRIALAAPHRSALATGMPVAVLIDEFHRLKGLHIEGIPDPRLVSLFAELMSYRKTPHVLTGNAAELQEIPVSNSLERIPVQPLRSADASSRALTLLHAHEAEGVMPPLLLRHLGGNPFYVEWVVRTACAKKNPGEKDFWNAYIHELMEGTLGLSWSSVLKGFFPELGPRKTALAMTHKIHHTVESLSCRRIAKSFALSDGQAETLAHTLYLAGFIHGEFGVFRAVEDRVLRDVIDCLYMKELLAKPSHTLRHEFMEKFLPEKEEAVRFDITLPMTREAELVAAQGLEQIGKNLNINQEAIGQMQIALIEACINAIEHGRGMDDKVYVSVAVDEARLKVSVESAGQEFILQETGEPFRDQEASKAAGRGWGLKLIKRFVDQVTFEKTTYGTKIVLVKKIEKSADIQKEDTANRE